MPKRIDPAVRERVMRMIAEHRSEYGTPTEFADDLDTVADQLDRAFAKLNTYQMRTKRRPKRSSQAALPFETLPEQAAG